MARSLSGLGKRGLGLGVSPPSYDSSSDDESLLLGGSRSGSSAKRRRGSSVPAAQGAGRQHPPAHAACQNPLNNHLFDNPLFEEDEYRIGGGDDDSEEQEPYWLRGMPVSTCSGNSSKENTPLPPIGSVGSPDCFAELYSTPVLCALTVLEKKGLHPVGDGGFATLNVTIAGMLVLCRRASLRADEMSPQLLLTCLWLLMSTCSQYRSGLSYNANLFLHLHPDGASMLGALKSEMATLQRQVLQRAGWRVLLHDSHDLSAALSDLYACPNYGSVTSYIERCADEGRMPMGTHGHCPGTDAALRRFCAATPAGAAGWLAGKGPSRGPPPAPRVRTSGSSRSNHIGLDGSYWQTVASGELCSSSRQPLAPRNR